jgi:hypothetical protein
MNCQRIGPKPLAQFGEALVQELADGLSPLRQHAAVGGEPGGLDRELKPDGVASRHFAQLSGLKVE